VSDPTATAPTVDALVEPARRRSDWREGESLVLLDGQRWTLRKPADAEPEFSAELAAYRDTIARIDADAAAGTIDAAAAAGHVFELYRGLFQLGALLLQANYRVTPAEAGALLPFGDSEGSFLETTVRVGQGDPVPLNIINAVAELIGPALRSTPAPAAS
jgi:hypothetical protein